MALLRVVLGTVRAGAAFSVLLATPVVEDVLAGGTALVDVEGEGVDEVLAQPAPSKARTVPIKRRFFIRVSYILRHLAKR